jgi:hypothetical protein
MASGNPVPATVTMAEKEEKVEKGRKFPQGIRPNRDGRLIFDLSLP